MCACGHADVTRAHFCFGEESESGFYLLELASSAHIVAISLLRNEAGGGLSLNATPAVATRVGGAHLVLFSWFTAMLLDVVCAPRVDLKVQRSAPGAELLFRVHRANRSSTPAVRGR